MRNLSLILIVIMSLFLVGCEDTDVGIATQAGIEAIKAVTLDDEDVKRLSIAVAEQSDQKHVVAPPDDPYANRLQKLTGGHRKFNGYEFDFKVYLSPQVNAFAMADGSIRIYSGLMDMMDDSELMFVVGHEMGHVTEKHIKKKIMMAYAGSAVRKAIASQQNTAGRIARSALGVLTEALFNAQFSQQEEREADDLGVMFLKEAGYDVEPAISALTKLAALGNDHSFLATHPAPGDRAQRLRENVLSFQQTRGQSFFQRIIVWLKGLWSFAAKAIETTDKKGEGTSIILYDPSS